MVLSFELNDMRRGACWEPPACLEESETMTLSVAKADAPKKWRNPDGVQSSGLLQERRV